MSFFEYCRKTVSRVWKRPNTAEEELHPLQDTENNYSSSCYNLHKACLVGDVKAVRWYIENGKEDVNKPDEHGEPPIFSVIQKNHVILMKDLLNAGADINLVTKLKDGTNIAPAHIAAKFNRCDCMKMLLDHGADPNIPNLFGQAPLHVAARMKLNNVAKVLIEVGKAEVNINDHDNVTPLHLVATKENPIERKFLAETLLCSGANPFSQDNEGNTAFHEAAENGVEDVMQVLFEYQGYDKSTFRSIAHVLNKPRKDGYNCLHLAVKNGHEKVIQMCIDHKADVNLKSLNGDTPLHIACTKGHLYACKILLDNGANLEARDVNDSIAIHRTANMGHVKLLAYLIEKGTDINAFHRSGSPLVSASYWKQTEAVRYLLEAGATVTMRNILLDTCLHLAVKNGDIETVTVIMEKCGETLLELKDKSEKTALHLAAKTGNSEVLKILLSYNPDVRARDDRGKCPIHIAAENAKTECVRLLVEVDQYGICITDFMWRTALHYACFSPAQELLCFLLENGAEVNARDDKRWTPMMYVAYLGCACSTEVLVKHGTKVDLWDKNKMTALTIAAGQNKHAVVKTLLEHGADPSILNCAGLNCMDIALQNRFHDVCMVIVESDKWRKAIVSNETMELCLSVSPEIAKVILDKCMEYSGREMDNDYKVTYHFDLLDPDPEEKDPYYGPLVMKMAGRNELLSHPLTKKLLEVNWKNGVRFTYYAGMLFVSLAVAFLVVFLIWTKHIYEECYGIANVTSNGSSVESWQLIHQEDFCSKNVIYDHRKMFVSRWAIFVYFLFYLFKELCELYVERYEYFLEISNCLDVSGFVLFFIFGGYPSEDVIPFHKFQYGILGIFILFFSIFLWVRGFPLYGIYITMFLEVLATLIRVLFGFTLLFVGFSTTFYLAFHNSTIFKTYPDSAMKVMAMLMGELDYSGYNDDAKSLPSDIQHVAIFLFVAFCFTMTLVVNNLLIGLAVGDIEAVQKNAEIKLLSLRANPFLEKLVRSVRVPDDVCRCATMHKTMDFIINCLSAEVICTIYSISVYAKGPTLDLDITKVNHILAGRNKIPTIVLRKYHVQKITEMPNKKECERRQAEERKRRNKKKTVKRKKPFEDIVNASIIGKHEQNL